MLTAKEKPITTKTVIGFLARPKEFESPTFRLGGGRSILLSYGRICFLNLYNIQYLRRFVNGLYFHIADLYFTDFEGFRLAIRF